MKVPQLVSKGRVVVLQFDKPRKQWKKCPLDRNMSEKKRSREESDEIKERRDKREKRTRDQEHGGRGNLDGRGGKVSGKDGEGALKQKSARLDDGDNPNQSNKTDESVCEGALDLMMMGGSTNHGV